MSNTYKNAPIVEAVIEIRFEASVAPPLVKRASDSLRKFYPDSQQLKQYQVQIAARSDGGAPVSTSAEQLVWRRSANNEQEVALVGPLAFSVSQLAPYDSWASYFKRFSRDWSVWTDKVGRAKNARIGMRYINRIDVAMDPTGVLEQSDYVTITVQSDVALGNTRGYAVQSIFDAPSFPGVVVINTSINPAIIVPGFTSIFLDIDIGVDKEVPQNDEGIFELLGKMREDKNFIFQACTTEKAKAMFK